MEQEIEAELPSLAEKQGVDCDETTDKNAIMSTLNNSWQMKFIVRKIVGQEDTVYVWQNILFLRQKFFDKTLLVTFILIISLKFVIIMRQIITNFIQKTHIYYSTYCLSQINCRCKNITACVNKCTYHRVSLRTRLRNL